MIYCKKKTKPVIKIKDFALNPNTNIRLLKNVECYEHLHFNAEICVVLSGSLKVGRENEEFMLSYGMCAIIMPYEMHSYKSEGKTETVIIEFSTAMFDEIKDRSGFCSAAFCLSEASLDYIRAKYTAENHTDIYLKAIIYPILNDFFESVAESKISPVHSEIYRKALDYIAKNFSENINLKTAAEKIGCSYVYLSRVFSQTIGIPFTAFLNRHRVINSFELLKNTDRTITEIAYSCGFGTLRSYNREFKKCLNITPKEYRIYGYNQYYES